MSIDPKNSKKFLSAKEAASHLGYTTDYVGSLCRQGKLNSKKVGKAWFVEEASIARFSKKNGKIKDIEKKLNSNKLSKNFTFHNDVVLVTKKKILKSSLVGILTSLILIASFIFSIIPADLKANKMSANVLHGFDNSYKKVATSTLFEKFSDKLVVIKPSDITEKIYTNSFGYVASIFDSLETLGKNTAYNFFCKIQGSVGNGCKVSENKLVEIDKSVSDEKSTDSDSKSNNGLVSNSVINNPTYVTKIVSGNVSKDLLTALDLENRLQLFKDEIVFPKDRVITERIVKTYDTQIDYIYDSTGDMITDAVNGIITLNNLTGVVSTNATISYLTVTSTSTFSDDVNFENGIKLNGQFGTAGQVLTSQGTSTDPVWADASSGGLQLLEIFKVLQHHQMQQVIYII